MRCFTIRSIQISSDSCKTRNLSSRASPKSIRGTWLTTRSLMHSVANKSQKSNWWERRDAKRSPNSRLIRSAQLKKTWKIIKGSIYLAKLPRMSNSRVLNTRNASNHTSWTNNVLSLFSSKNKRLKCSDTASRPTTGRSWMIRRLNITNRDKCRRILNLISSLMVWRENTLPY